MLAPGRMRESSIAQIALRSPSGAQAQTSAPNTPLGALSAPPELRPHIDGSYSPSNGVRSGQVAHFTLLCRVALSDVPTDFAGNFTVWPGSHLLCERYFQTHGVHEMVHGTPNSSTCPSRGSCA